MIDAKTVQDTLSMFDRQNLDVRAVTLGISLQPCVAVSYRGVESSPGAGRTVELRDKSRAPELTAQYPDLFREVDAFALAIYRRITAIAGEFVETVKKISSKYGIKVANHRISVTPVGGLVGQFFADDMLFGGIDSYEEFKHHEKRELIEEIFLAIGTALDEARDACNIDVLGGFSALVQKGATRGERFMMYSIPRVLAETKAVCSSINVATTRAGINMDAVALLGQVIEDLADRTKGQNSFGCCKLVVYANMPEDNPYMAGAIHGPGEADAVINVGVSGPGVILAALESFIGQAEVGQTSYLLGDLADVIKRASYRVTKVGELIGIEAARDLSVRFAEGAGDSALAQKIRAGQGRGAVEFGVVDVSLAPTYKDGDSIAQILETIGVMRVGMPGTTAALAMLTDAVKKGGTFASKFVGGMSGAFIPVSEDRYMEKAYREGSLTLEKLEAMTSVCSVGLDMIAIRADRNEGAIHPSIWSGIIADEIAVGVFGAKTTAVRIIPILEPVYKDEEPEQGCAGEPLRKVVFGVPFEHKERVQKDGVTCVHFSPEELEGNLWGEAAPMPLNSCYLWRDGQPTGGKDRQSWVAEFAVRGGRIPAPIHSLRN